MIFPDKQKLEEVTTRLVLQEMPKQALQVENDTEK